MSAALRKCGHSYADGSMCPESLDGKCPRLGATNAPDEAPTESSPEPRLTLAWGSWPVPETALVAWGARAIYTYNHAAHVANQTARGTKRKRRVMDYFTIDLVWDRQSAARDPAQTTEADAEALGAWINKIGLPELRRLCNDRFIAGDSGETIELERDGYALKAGPRASHGYLYIVAWKVGIVVDVRRHKRGPLSEISEAFKQRADTAQRRLVIAALGWRPEPTDDAPGCYAATTGELLAWLYETQPLLAMQIRETHSNVLKPYYVARL